MVNEGFDNVFDSSTIDYASHFEKKDLYEYDKQRALDWVFTNCCDIYGYKLNPKNIRYNQDKTIDILSGGLCMRGHNFGKVGKRWCYSEYKNEGETITEIPEYVNFRICYGSCDFDQNELTTLERSPRVILQTENGSGECGDFFIGYNKLESLKGFPEYIAGDLYCNHNPLQSFSGINLNWVKLIYGGHSISYPDNLVPQWLDLVRKHAKKGEDNGEIEYLKELYKKYNINSIINEGFDNIFDSSTIDYASRFENDDKLYQIKSWIENSIEVMDKSGGSFTNRYKKPEYNVDYKINYDYTIDMLSAAYVKSPDRWHSVIDDLKHKYPSELPDYISFNIAHDGFYLTKKSGFTSMKGFPKKVFGGFYIWEQELKSLEGGPEIVTGNYNAYGNKLESLVGSPEIIGADYGVKVFFNVNSNKLKNLIGGPKIVYGNYTVQNNKLESLEGYPKMVMGEFNIKFNKNLLSINEVPINGVNGQYIESWGYTPEQGKIFVANMNEGFSNILDSSTINYAENFEKKDIDWKNQQKEKIQDWCKKHVFIYNEGSSKEGIYSRRPAKIEVLDNLSIDVDDTIYFDYFEEENYIKIKNNYGISLPDYIQFNTIRGSMHAEGDNWWTFKGFPYRIEGILYLNYNDTLKSYEYFPKEVHGFELLDYNTRIKDFIKYLPNIIEEQHSSDPAYIKIYDSNLSKETDEILFLQLVKKYLKPKPVVDSIETAAHYTGDGILDESFNNIFDSSGVDYAAHFESSDQRYVIENWIKKHIIDKHRNLETFICYRDLGLGISDDIYKDHIYSYTINNDYSVDFIGDIVVVLEPKEHKIPIKINTVQGDFIIGHPWQKIHDERFDQYNYQLKSLENMPNIVYGDFNVSYGNFENLVGSPIHVNGDFKAMCCNLKSIKGISKYIRGNIFLRYNYLKDSEKDFKNYLKNYNGEIYINGNGEWTKSMLYSFLDSHSHFRLI